MEKLKEYAVKLGMVDFFFKGRFLTNHLVEQAYFLSHDRPKAESAVLVAGSGRSGTTWVHEVLGSIPGTQLLFEPLNQNFVEEASILTNIPKSTQPRIFSQYLRPEQIYPNWHTFLENILTGRVRNTWVDRRINWGPTNQYIIKVIRGNLMLGFIKENFNPKIIFVIRHPCAVILSRLNNGWIANIDDLLTQEDLIEDHLRPWVGLIEKERDLIGAQAVWWAVENMVAMRELVDKKCYLLIYEDLCLDPQNSFADLFSWLGYPNQNISQKIIHQPSRLSDNAYSTTKDRLEYWKSNMSIKTQERILRWAERLGIKLYSDDLRIR